MRITFNQIIEQSRPRILEALWTRAILADRTLQVGVGERARRAMRSQQDAALSRLVSLEAVEIDSVGVDETIVTIVVPGQPHFRVCIPFVVLSPMAQEAVTDGGRRSNLAHCA